MSTDEQTSKDARLNRLEQASEWLLRMDNPARTEEDVNEWLRWCDESSENLVAFEAFQGDWRDLDALKVGADANESALAPSRVASARLSGEEVRDSILAVSGALNLKQFGPSTYPKIPKEVLAGQSVPGRGWNKSPPEEQNRRSVYIHVKRSLLFPILDIFDLAEADRSTAVRFSSTQPTQALAMLNSDFINKQAAMFARRLKQDTAGDVDRQVRLALYLATSRQPTEKEIRRGAELVRLLQSEERLSPDAALQTFCLMVLNLNEFVYLD